jgi:hypothetical protein
MEGRRGEERARRSKRWGWGGGGVADFSEAGLRMDGDGILCGGGGRRVGGARDGLGKM